MKFGVREICDVVFKAKTSMKIGNNTFKKGQPVLYIDTATASTLEQATTTVYAQGGKGNTRLVAWEGEKQVTFTVTDALLSPIGLAILSGAGLFKAESDTVEVHVHTTARAVVEGTTGGVIDLTSALADSETIDSTAPIFISVTEADGSITGELISTGVTVDNQGKKINITGSDHIGKTVFVDFYITKKSKTVSEIQIDAQSFGGNFYVEASTLFRGTDGKDYPAEVTIPNVKVQSNFTFSMAATGDPSTFDFTMDAFPDYTMFDKTHKVICVIQMLEDANSGTSAHDTVMGHKTGEKPDGSTEDSTPGVPSVG